MSARTKNVASKRSNPAKAKRPLGGRAAKKKRNTPGFSAKNENAPRGRASDKDSSFLSMYFREMALLDVLKPEEEFEHARNLEALEISIWRIALSYPATVDHVLAILEAKLEERPTRFRQLRKVALVAKKSRLRGDQHKLEALVDKVAPKLHELDRDRINLDALLVDLDRLHRMVPARSSAGRLPFSVKSKGFESYMSQLRSADRKAAFARNAFVKANLRLVVSIARRFNHGRMSLADLIQEGNIGLMKAVERYDYRRGFRFSTYASWWIRHAISRALADKGREVRLPVHMIDAHHKLSRAKRELTARHGRTPTTAELADATALPPAKIEKMRTYLVDQSFSLDRPVNDEDGRSFGEFLQDPSFEECPPEERITTELMTSEVRRLLRDLKPIEADILRRRFGLEDDKELTLKQIGERYGLSRERIRQLQEQALDKMRRALARRELL